MQTTPTTVAYRVDDMTCGHCVAAITKAVHAIDPQADVKADPATHRVEVASKAAGAAAIEAAIRDAGYTPLAQPG